MKKEYTEITNDLMFPEGPISMPDGSIILVEIARGTLTQVHNNGSKDILAELSDCEDSEVRENIAMNLSTPLEINVKLTADSSSFVINEALKTLHEKRNEPKDELLAILKDIVGKLSASGEKVGELGGADVVSGGLMQEDVDHHTEQINSRIKELEG